MVHVTPNEIKLIIIKLPNKKAPGHDRITNIIFKMLPTIGLVLMTALFNTLLRLVHFPLKWKIASHTYQKNLVRINRIQIAIDQ